MIYTNDKLRIVPFERAKHMTDEYRSWFHDPEVTRFNSHGLFPYSPGAMEAFVKTIEQGSDSKIVWAIEVPGIISIPDAHEQTQKRQVPGWIHIGNCSLDRINWINRSAEITIVLGKERGKGHGEQTCRWMLEHAFFKLGMFRVWTGTAVVNSGMNAVCKKIGMLKEGVLRGGMFLNGHHTDINMWAILYAQYNK